MTTSHLNWLRELPGRPLVVAEIKQRSPYGWVNPYSVEGQLDICEAVGDIISVHTNPLWGGSWSHLSLIRSMTRKPILAKGFHDTIHDVQRALDCGADHVLTVGWHPGGELGKRCWFEVETLDQLRSAYPRVKAVWNARDPRTGAMRPLRGRADVTVHVRGANDYRARPDVPKPWLCQASHIRGPQDVVPGMDAILIGEGLYTQP